MSESYFPRTLGDIESAHLADTVYRNGAWLAFAVDSTPTEEQLVLLGGEYDDRALNDLGYDGIVIAQNKRLFEPDDPHTSIQRLVTGQEPTDSDRRRGDLYRRSQFYTSPVVREPERLKSKVPVEVPTELDNVLWTYNGKANSLAVTFGTEPHQLNSGVEVQFDGYHSAWFCMEIPEGKRLVIDSIPKGAKGVDPKEEPVPYMQVHIYPNAHGYLVADKVMDGLIVGGKRPVSLKVGEDGQLQIDQDAAPAKQDLYPSNDKKQEFRDPLNPDHKLVQLLTTTAQWSIEAHLYDTLEITVKTPDDAGRYVLIDFGNSDCLPAPIIMRLVDDTTEELHPLFQ